MTLNEIIHILENKLIYLDQQKTIFVNFGEIQRVSEIELEINEIQIALQKLKS